MIAELQINLSEEQELVRDGARRLAKEDYPALAPGEAWGMMAELGWLGCALPEAQGGYEGGTRMLALVAQEFGRGLVAEPLVPVASLSLQLLANLGTPEAARLANEIAAGELKLFTAADQLPPLLHEAGVEAVSTPQGWRLDGQSLAIPFGDRAHAFIVPARHAGELLLLLVRPDLPGLEIDAYPTFDGRTAVNLGFDKAAVAAEALLGSGAPAEAAMVRAIDHALVMASAEMLGAIETAFDVTRDYLRTRRQFGQPIGEFQVLRHRLVDMFIEVEQARSMVLLGVSAIDASDARTRSAIASAVKSRVGRAAKYVAGQAVQLHGGIGMTEEHLPGPIFQRATAYDLWLGTASRHQARYAGLRKAP